MIADYKLNMADQSDTSHTFPRDFLDTLQLSGKDNKPELYDEFRSYYRTYGEI